MTKGALIRKSANTAFIKESQLVLAESLSSTQRMEPLGVYDMTMDQQDCTYGPS